MNTDKKYTIILSAWQATAPLSVNLENTSNLSAYLKYQLHLDVIEAVGHYKGGCEISFVIATNSARTVYRLKAYVCKEYRQECILVSSNKHALIELHNMYSVDKIGTHFTPGKGDGENYTRLSHGEYWSVS